MLASEGAVPRARGARHSRQPAAALQLMFVPALGTHQTLAFIGFVQPLGATCVAELQERLAALVFKVSTLIASMTAQTLAVSKQHVLYCVFFNS